MNVKYCAIFLWGSLIATVGFGQKEVVWDKKINVETGRQNFDGTDYYAYSVPIYETKAKDITKNEIKDLVKEKHSKLSVKKGILRAEKVMLADLHPGPMDVMAFFDKDKKHDAVIMHIAFVHGDGTAINPDDFPREHKKTEDLVYQLGVELNRAVVRDQLAEQEKILEKMEKELEKLEKQEQNLERDAEKAEKNLADAEKDQQKEEQDLAEKRQELQELERQVGLTPSEEQAKELAKLRKDIEKSEKKIAKLLKAEDKYEQNRTDAGEETPKKQEDINEMMKEIAEQKELIEQYKKKLAAVQ